MKHLSLVVTTKCNFRCKMCNYWKSNPEKITFSDCKKIISPGLFSSVSFTGGEPLLHKGICRMAELAQNKGIKTTLATNGFLIDTFKKDIFLNFDSVLVSLHGLRETQKRICGVDAFDRIIENLLLLQKIHVPFTIRSVVQPDNIHELPLLKEYLVNTGLPENRIMFVRTVGQFGYLDLDKDTFRMNADDYNRLSKSFPRQRRYIGIAKKRAAGRVVKGCISPL